MSLSCILLAIQYWKIDLRFCQIIYMFNELSALTALKKLDK